MPKETFSEIARWGYVEELKKALAQENRYPSRLVAILDEWGNSPLFDLIKILDKRSGAYENAIILLEHGADPFQEQQGHAIINFALHFEHDPSPFILALFRGYLAFVRLMLWYAPDYEKVEMKYKDLRDDEEIKTTAEEYARWVDAGEVKEGKGRGFARCIQETAEDAKQLRRLRRAAEFAEVGKNHEEAATHYQLMARLYAKHKALEESLVYYPHGPVNEINLPVEEYRKIFVDYYHTKTLACYEKAYVHYQALDSLFSSSGYPEQASIDAHIALLNQIISLVTLLSKEAERRRYLNKIAQVIMTTPGLITPPEVESKDDNHLKEETPLLEKTAANRSTLFRRSKPAMAKEEAAAAFSTASKPPF